MELNEPLWHLHQVACHRDLFLPGGLPFDSWDILAPNISFHDYIFWSNGTVMYLIAADYPFVVLIQRVDKGLVEVS